jgi:hypothetical protein
MKPDFYRTIKETLKKAPGIHSVGLWTNKMVDQVDTIRRFPVALVEFTDMAYNSITAQRQECLDPHFVVHILNDSIDLEASSIFEVSQAVFAAMHNEGFRRVRERSVYRGDEIVEWQITFDAPRFEDNDAVTPKTVIAPPEPEFDIPF